MTWMHPDEMPGKQFRGVLIQSGGSVAYRGSFFQQVGDVSAISFRDANVSNPAHPGDRPLGVFPLFG